MIRTVSFPRFPVWNYHFPELDVVEIRKVSYYAPDGAPAELDLEQVRLTCGANGVSGIAFKEKHALPATAERPDAVTIEYEA